MAKSLARRVCSACCRKNARRSRLNCRQKFLPPLAHSAAAIGTTTRRCWFSASPRRNRGRTPRRGCPSPRIERPASRCRCPKVDLGKKKRLGLRPKPLDVSRNSATRELLAPFLYLGCFRSFFGCFFRFRFGLGFFGLRLGLLFRSSFLGWFSRGLGGSFGGSFGRGRRCYRLFLGDENLFLFGFHDLVTAAQLVFLLQP